MSARLLDAGFEFNNVRMISVRLALIFASLVAIHFVSLHNIYLRWTPHPVIVTISDNKEYIRVLLYSYHTTITGWGGPLNIDQLKP